MNTNNDNDENDENWVVPEWERFERDVDALEKERLRIIQKNRCDENDFIIMESLFNNNFKKESILNNDKINYKTNDDKTIKKKKKFNSIIINKNKNKIFPDV
jgi:hypothetical protein